MDEVLGSTYIQEKGEVRLIFWDSETDLEYFFNCNRVAQIDSFTPSGGFEAVIAWL